MFISLNVEEFQIQGSPAKCALPKSDFAFIAEEVNGHCYDT